MVAFWSKDKDKKGIQKPVKKDSVISTIKKSEKKVVKEPSFFQTETIGKTILFPVISEDAMNKQALGKYVFQVSNCANKSEVKKAISARFGVLVKKVNILNLKAKKTFFKGKKGSRKQIKKAIVTLEKGQTIEFFSTK